MCRELVRDYENWLNEILSILDAVCEDVIPAGKSDESIYWRTKKLYEDAEGLAREGKRAELEKLLNTYLEDGQGLLLQFGQEWCWRKLRANSRSEKNEGCNGRTVASKLSERDDKFQLSEENRILLRRKYARKIVDSLQMLVNLAFLLDEYFEYCTEDVRQMFELESSYEVKRVRPGVSVNVHCVQQHLVNLKFA